MTLVQMATKPVVVIMLAISLIILITDQHQEGKPMFLDMC